MPTLRSLRVVWEQEREAVSSVRALQALLNRMGVFPSKAEGKLRYRAVQEPEHFLQKLKVGYNSNLSSSDISFKTEGKIQNRAVQDTVNISCRS